MKLAHPTNTQLLAAGWFINRNRNGERMKWLFSFLLLASLALFAIMQWGGALTGSARNGQGLVALNPEKILLLKTPVAKQMPGSAATQVQADIAVFAPTAISPPAAVSAVLPVSAPPSLPLPVPTIATVPLGKPTAIKTCMEWGEFSGADLARADKELDKFKLGEQLAQRTVEYASGYWVYIPPLSSRDAVNKKIAEIKALGVEDFYIVKDTRKWYNAISLGVFKTEEAAKNFQAILKKKGIRTAKMGERKHKLKFTVFMLKNVDTALASRLTVLQKDFTSSELKHVPCNI